MSTLLVLLWFISLGCLILGLAVPKLFTFLFKTVPSRKKIGVVFGISTVVLFILLGVASSKSTSQTKEESNPTDTPTIAKAITTPTAKPATSSGLNITRDAAISGFQRINSSINFQPSTSVNGIDRYMATIGQNNIELYGKADNLVEIASTALFSNNAADHAGNAAALVYIIGAANIVDEGSKGWATATLKEISTAWQNGQNSVKKSTVINGKKFDITALKTDALDTITLTIYSAQSNTPPTDTKTDATNSNSNSYPGMTKVKLNASLAKNTQGMVFTNNENKDWKYCIVTINPEDGASNWYEYDFGDISSHQTFDLIPWDKLTREDSTTFDHSTMTAKTIELSCELYSLRS